MNQTRMKARLNVKASAIGAAVVLHCFCSALSAQHVDASQAGLHTYKGHYITLITDIDDQPQSETLVTSFDTAVPQWTAFWGITDQSLGDFKVTAYVMKAPKAFQSSGLIPPGIPPFEFGYAAGRDLWVVAQKSEYYTRHLLLHEGVHALMFHQFGGAGPSWFMEGTAELLSTHRGMGTKTAINQVPTGRDTAAYWGRLKLISARRDAGQTPTIESVMKYPKQLNSDVESYAWSWAATMLFSSYDEYQRVFNDVAKIGQDRSPEFNRFLHNRLRSDWPILVARWRLLAHDLDFGFDWSRQKTELARTDKLWDGRPLTFNVDATKGWQSTGVRFGTDMNVQIDASGRCVIENPKQTETPESTTAETNKAVANVITFSTPERERIATRPWQSEPSGVTIEYHDSAPLGQLQVILLPLIAKPVGAKRDRLRSLDVISVGKSNNVKVSEPCWMVFRINDAAGTRSDNEGVYQVTLSMAQ